MQITVVESGVKKAINQAVQKRTPVQYGTWGVVTDVNAKTNCVDVRLSSGVILKEVPVACTNEWVCEYKDAGYISGSRNLPPEHARVFLLMPTGTFESAFVLCSGLSRYEKAHEKAFMASSDSERSGKNTVRETVLPGKWKEQYDYQKGSYTLTSPNEKIQLTVHDDNEKQEISFAAFGTDIAIDKAGNISIKAADGKKIALNGDKYSGMVKADVLKQELGKMTARIDGIINAIKSAAVTPQDGGAGFKSAMIASLSALVNKENFSNIKNEKVVHGE